MHHDTQIKPAVQAAKAMTTAQPRKNTFRLLRYRVTNFRSVTDSGFLDLDHVTALIGVNESGKTNLLLPLWKLNPASGGTIDPMSDYPKAMFGAIRKDPASFQFVQAEFETGEVAAELAELGKIPVENAGVVSVGRHFDGSYTVTFPLHRPPTAEDPAGVRARIRETAGIVRLANDGPAQAELQSRALDTLQAMDASLHRVEHLTANDLIRMRDRVAGLIPEDPPAVSQAVAELRGLQKDLGQRMANLLKPDPGQIDAVRKAVLERMPVFVFYSNYGNLDSEIYLPHVVENMKRTDLGAKEAAKARTLKVLFGFVGLQADEILQLGRDFRDIRDQADAAAIMKREAGFFDRVVRRRTDLEAGPDEKLLAEISEAKRTRSILLQSASTKLTARFGEWWKQGDYRFRFEADGNHFRIWVADARRPQEVELENRSTGLQWFLSFFLIFLHETRLEHSNAVILLDEPGHSLHPLAQRDLSAFFDGLAETNQIVYTTHSPFLVDADRLERARKVFVERDGSTRVSGDLAQDEGSDTKKGASFAVRAALNISVAEAMLTGAKPVLVRSTVEQIYLSTIKTILIASGRWQPNGDMIFAPAAGPRVMQGMAALLTGEDHSLPPVLVDGTQAGRNSARSLRASSHAGCPERVIALDEVIGIHDATIEELVDIDLLVPLVDRVERRPERVFADVVKRGFPLVPQVEAWAAADSVALQPDWRTQLALRARARLLKGGISAVDPSTLDMWMHLVSQFERTKNLRSSANVDRDRIVPPNMDPTVPVSARIIDMR